MFRIPRVVFFFAVVAVMTASYANASTIGPNCSTCQGSTYTLTNLGLAPIDLDPADGSFDTWRIALTIDTSGYTGTGVQINEVAIKVASSTDAAALVSAPGGIADWQLVPGGLNASGCNGSGSGFDCSNWLVGSADGATVGGAPLTWIFDVDVSSPLLTGDGAATIKAQYVDANNNKVGALVSEDITLTSVPEPGTLALLALGVGGVSIGRRRS